MPFLPPNQQRQSTEGKPSTEGSRLIVILLMVDDSVYSLRIACSTPHMLALLLLPFFGHYTGQSALASTLR